MVAEGALERRMARSAGVMPYLGVKDWRSVSVAFSQKRRRRETSSARPPESGQGKGYCLKW